ncbi:hypothetical protein ATO7_12133 [Oceanococcus atlanticus]|uniref:Uncharacterized protein n=1 Tax=Oceanococcus atlanticus TaxID=1317117 RepID=A0A1Y1SBN5_9GAMM|nr:hypothetical protein [Oceanococcus atlanticus]ORE86042.1 hypothetical protein ATO7_12133 [Oceanococcus atlanticus]
MIPEQDKNPNTTVFQGAESRETGGHFSAEHALAWFDWLAYEQELPLAYCSWKDFPTARWARLVALTDPTSCFMMALVAQIPCAVVFQFFPSYLLCLPPLALAGFAIYVHVKRWDARHYMSFRHLQFLRTLPKKQLKPIYKKLDDSFSADFMDVDNIRAVLFDDYDKNLRKAEIFEAARWGARKRF